MHWWVHIGWEAGIGASLYSWDPQDGVQVHENKKKTPFLSCIYTVWQNTWFLSIQMCFSRTPNIVTKMGATSEFLGIV